MALRQVLRAQIARPMALAQTSVVSSGARVGSASTSAASASAAAFSGPLAAPSRVSARAAVCSGVNGERRRLLQRSAHRMKKTGSQCRRRSLSFFFLSFVFFFVLAAALVLAKKAAGPAEGARLWRRSADEAGWLVERKKDGPVIFYSPLSPVCVCVCVSVCACVSV